MKRRIFIKCSEVLHHRLSIDHRVTITAKIFSLKISDLPPGDGDPAISRPTHEFVHTTDERLPEQHLASQQAPRAFPVLGTQKSITTATLS